jgi:hypothetical protein
MSQGLMTNTVMMDTKAMLNDILQIPNLVFLELQKGEEQQQL